MTGSNTIENLETCLKKLEAGLPLETILAEYAPDQRDELRELLLAALAAQLGDGRARVPASAQVNSRRRMLARAQDLAQQRERQQEKGLSVLQVLLHSLLNSLRAHLPSAAFILAMLLLLFIALRSAGALNGPLLTPQTGAEGVENKPGESLAEQIDRAAADDQARTAEVAQMVKANQSGAVRFTGFLKPGKTESVWEANGIKLSFLPQSEEQARLFSGEYVEIQGTLSAGGIVQVASIQQRTIPVEGVLQSIENGFWRVEGLPVQVTEETIVQGTPVVGDRVSMEVTRKENQAQVFAVNAHFAGMIQALPGKTIQPAGTPTKTVPPAASPTAKASHTPLPEQTPQTVVTRTGIENLDPGETETPEIEEEVTSDDDNHDEDDKREEKKDEKD